MQLQDGDDEGYWVYKMYDHVQASDPCFVFFDKLTDIVCLSSLKKSALFRSDVKYELELVSHHRTRLEAENALNRAVGVKFPSYNLQLMAFNHKMRVLCVETGEIYNSAAEIIRKFGFNQAALSNHLNRKSGYRQVKGFRFVYTDAPWTVKFIPNAFEPGDYYLPKVYHYVADREAENADNNA